MVLKGRHNECNECNKNLTSLLIDIAIDQGLIKSVDDFVMDYYKETYTPKEESKLYLKLQLNICLQ